MLGKGDQQLLAPAVKVNLERLLNPAADANALLHKQGREVSDALHLYQTSLDWTFEIDLILGLHRQFSRSLWTDLTAGRVCCNEVGVVK